MSNDLQMGTWFSELDEEAVRDVKRRLGLPFSKSLVYRRAVMDDIEDVLVVDMRVVEICDECGMVTIEVALDGDNASVRMLAPYFVSMQGKGGGGLE